MMHKSLSFAVLVALSLVAVSASADGQILKPVEQVRQVVAEIPLQCTGSGHSDVRSRNHSIKNTLTTTIPKGFVIRWRTNTGLSGSVALTNDMPPNDTIDVIEPGQTNGYSCTAGFFAGDADLAVKSVKWSNATTAQIEIVNNNPFTNANASVVRVQSLKCVSVGVASVDIAVPALAKGGTTTITTNLAHANADYLQATANVTNTVAETNKANNSMKSIEFLQMSSCTPK